MTMHTDILSIAVAAADLFFYGLPPEWTDVTTLCAHWTSGSGVDLLISAHITPCEAS